MRTHFQDLVKYYAQKSIPGDNKIILGTDNITEELITSFRGNTIHKKIIIEWEEWWDNKESAPFILESKGETNDGNNT